MAVPNVVLLGLLATLASAVALDPCPFNTKECQCIPDTRTPPKYDYTTVVCRSDSLWMPILFTSSGKKYAINSFLISGDVANLPANYLSGFKSIETLELSDWGPRVQSWDPMTFNGTKIGTLIVSDLGGVIPPPPALSLLGANGLQQLHVRGVFGGFVKLPDSQFNKFTSLVSLSIAQPITEIGEMAFSGLEKTLISLTLTNTSYRNSSVDRHLLKAVAKLSNLVDLTLDGTGVSRIPGGYFSAFQKLSMLQLSYDNLSYSTDAGALYDLPSSLWLVTLRQIGLTRVPRMVYAKDQDVPGTWLDIRGNPIEALLEEDFRGNTIYGRVALKGTKLVYLDLSSLASLGKGVTYDFGDNKYLKFLTASSLEEVPRDGKVSINPSLEIIDPNLANVFARYPQFSLDLSNNQNLDCENLAWIAPYVMCFNRVQVSSAYCSTGQGVKDYLNNIGFKCNPL